MAKQLQLRRGTTLQNNAFIGAVGEPTLDTETGMIHIHDGQTQGGKEFIDAVVAFQKPTAENNYTWYRKYASGWVEQGQTNLILQDSVTTYTLPIEMESGYYNLCVGFNQSSDGTTMPSTYDRTTTTFSVNSPTGNVAGWWEVKGMSA